VSLSETVQRLQDRLDIQELLAGYCRHADLLDAQGMASYFTDDCVVTYLPPEMGAPLEGKTALLDSLLGSHHIANVELLFDTPDRVTGHTYMYSWQRFKTAPAAADCHRWGRYELRLLRTKQGWRVSHMRLVSVGELGGRRIAEQFGRPWPPRFE
jgi:ketosteroid isomerase-like protein